MVETFVPQHIASIVIPLLTSGRSPYTAVRRCHRGHDPVRLPPEGPLRTPTLVSKCRLPEWLQYAATQSEPAHATKSASRRRRELTPPGSCLACRSHSSRTTLAAHASAERGSERAYRPRRARQKFVQRKSRSERTGPTETSA